MYIRLILIPVSLVLIASLAFGQTTLNPDISLIGDMRAFSHDDDARADESEKLNLSDPQMELFIDGYLNPYARAAATVAWHPGADAEIEEIYATILRGLPLGMNLRAGKYLLEFGRLNPTHPHAYSFLYRTLPHELFFGEEGLSDMAVRASVLLPTGSAYTELMGAVLKGDALLGHHHHDEEEEEAAVALRITSPGRSRAVASVTQDEHEGEEDTRPDLGFFGRLTTSFAASESAELALGASVVNAVYEQHHHGEEAVETLAVTSAQQSEEEIDQMRAWVTGLDAKYKYRPSRYTAVQIEGEVLMRSEEQHEGDNLLSYAGYGYLDYRFRQRYNVGGIFEYVTLETVDEASETTMNSDVWRAGLFAGFSPVEETSVVRLVGSWTAPDDTDGFWELTLQFVFSLGPHKPHNF